MKRNESRYTVAMLEGRPGWYRCTDTESGIELDFDITDPNGKQEGRAPAGTPVNAARLASLMGEMGDFLSAWLSEQQEFEDGCLSAAIDRQKRQD